MSSRLPKDGTVVRVHIGVPRKWLKTIDAAAKKLNLSRSQFIASAAFELACEETNRAA